MFVDLLRAHVAHAGNGTLDDVKEYAGHACTRMKSVRCSLNG